VPVASAPVESRIARVVRAAEVDVRMLGLLAALGLIWIALGVATDGVFLSARNLYNLAVQSSVVGIMATGMVFVIVARHIDLSVGSVLGFTGMAIAVMQVEVLPGAGFGWPLAIALGLVLGAGIGAWQGYWVAYRGLPAFVVTLAGLLIFRGGAFLLTDGRTVAPLEPGYQRLGGGIAGSIGAPASLALGAVGVALLVAGVLRARATRRAHRVPVKPGWADAALLALGTAGIAAFVLVMNSVHRPGGTIPRGIPVPVLILIAVGVATAALARVTRFGRHVFAIGGNPEAARLAGIEVERVTLGVFVLMGGLCAVAAVITTARLGAGASSMGVLAELSVIAAAVIGGTSLAGGVGRVGGAILGAVLMQSLENGMVLLGVSSALRQVSIGLVLIAAVWLDSLRRERGFA
jgi:D-xylose transport system permease protein